MQKNKKIFYAISSTITAILFGGLALGVKFHLSFVRIIDHYEHHVLTSVLGRSAAPTINFLSNLGSPVVGIILITLIALILCYQKEFLTAFFIETATILGNVIAELFKIIIARPRPSYRIYPDNSFSFPSGHVFDTTLLVLVVITFLLPKLRNETYQIICGVLLIIWNGFVIFSRVFLGAHYFTDTLGSILLAFTLWTLTLLIRQIYLKRLAQNK